VRKWLIGGILVLLVAGGAYYAVAIYPTKLFRDALDQTLRTLPAGQTGSYASVSFSLLSRKATVTGAAFHRSDPNGFDLTASEIDVTRPATDFGDAWARAAANPGAIAPDLALVLGDDVTARDVSYRDDSATLKLATFQVAQPRAYPWALLHPDVPSMVEARSHLLEGTHAPDAADILPLLRAEAAWAYGFGYDSYSAQSLDATAAMPPTSTTKGGTIAYTVEKMSSGAYDRGNAASIAIDGTVVRSDVFGVITIAHVGLEELHAAKALAQLVAGDVPSPAMLDGLTLKRIVYGPMTLQPLKGASSELGNFALANIAFSHGLLSSGDLALDGVRVRRDQMPTPALAAGFEQLGIDAATVSLALGYRWDIDQKRMSIKGATLKVVELGRLVIGLDIDQVASQADLLSQGRFVRGTARYEDASLVNRALKFFAGNQGVDPEVLRKQVIAAVGELEADTRNDAATRGTAHAIAAFMAAPNSLQVDLAPPQPVPLVALLGVSNMTPDRSIVMFGVTATANK